MLVKGHRRLLVVLGCLLAFIAVAITFSSHLRSTLSQSEYIPRLWTPRQNATASGRNGKYPQQSLHGGLFKPVKNLAGALATTGSSVANSHNVVYSNTTADGKYFLIDFGDYEAINANLIPHPNMPDTWIAVAQRHKMPPMNMLWSTELVCEGTLRNDTFKCNKSPLILPMVGTHSSVCLGDLQHLDLNIGPHDARVFFGPRSPYIVYGSQSEVSCFGQWIQDFRLLVDWTEESQLPPRDEAFVLPVDLQRPPPQGAIEKNWFIFWDLDGEMYVHHDVSPRRVFAKLSADGSVSEDLAPFASATDKVCWRKHLEADAPAYKSIHQATNSLSITLCNRHDSDCKVNGLNTFIMTIFQHKSYENWHSAYEPYVMLFRPTPPFEMYAVSSKPIWIHGRDEALKRPQNLDADKIWNETEMIYVTSMNWKTAGQRYHGYLDDVLFLGIGIEDKASGGIDVRAADVLQGLDLCDQV